MILPYKLMFMDLCRFFYNKDLNYPPTSYSAGHLPPQGTLSSLERDNCEWGSHLALRKPNFHFLSH